MLKGSYFCRSGTGNAQHWSDTTQAAFRKFGKPSKHFSQCGVNYSGNYGQRIVPGLVRFRVLRAAGVGSRTWVLERLNIARPAYCEPAPWCSL